MAKINIFLIVGYRRWARILAEELCSRTKIKSPIYLIGDPKNKELTQWLKNTGLTSRIVITKKIINNNKKGLALAFIVNSAYMHEFYVKDLLCKGYNVICEKPISFSKTKTIKLINLAAKKKLNLFCTNTYFFASYLKKLKYDFLKEKNFTNIDITWADPEKEIRYKQIKNYDSSVPIIYDILPHIANILYATIGNFKLKLSNVDIKNGGSNILLHYQKKKMNIAVHLIRNADSRKRAIKFISKKNQLYFDFTNEPGFLKRNNDSQFKLDIEWKTRLKPIPEMISSVINYFELGKKDYRLKLKTSLLGNELIDVVAKKYVNNQIQILENKKMFSKKSYSYAYKEFKSIKKRTAGYIDKDSILYNFSKSKKYKL